MVLFLPLSLLSLRSPHPFMDVGWGKKKGVKVAIAQRLEQFTVNEEMEVRFFLATNSWLCQHKTAYFLPSRRSFFFSSHP